MEISFKQYFRLGFNFGLCTSLKLAFETQLEKMIRGFNLILG